MLSLIFHTMLQNKFAKYLHRGYGYSDGYWTPRKSSLLPFLLKLRRVDWIPTYVPPPRPSYFYTPLTRVYYTPLIQKLANRIIRVIKSHSSEIEYGGGVLKKIFALRTSMYQFNNPFLI